MSDKPISQIVKDPEWQKVRIELLGNWKKRPKWCVQQLRKYLGSINTTSEEKLRIVQNYLTGTAFRTGKISSRENSEIPRLRGEISAEFKKRKFKEKN